LSTETKQCRKCSEVKSIGEFYVDNKSKDGLKGECKECVKLYKRTHKKARRDYDIKFKGTARCKFLRLKSFARKHSIVFDIEYADFYEWYGMTLNVCHYCGRDIVTTNQKALADSLSIDMLDNDGVYTLNNIVKSCHGCKSGKRFCKHADFMEYSLDKSFMEQDLRVCSKCKEVKPIKEFSKDRRAKDGYHNRCRGCDSLYYKEYWEKHGCKLNKRKCDNYKQKTAEKKRVQR